MAVFFFVFTGYLLFVFNLFDFDLFCRYYEDHCFTMCSKLFNMNFHLKKFSHYSYLHFIKKIDLFDFFQTVSLIVIKCRIVIIFNFLLYYLLPFIFTSYHEYQFTSFCCYPNYCFFNMQIKNSLDFFKIIFHYLTQFFLFCNKKNFIFNFSLFSIQFIIMSLIYFLFYSICQYFLYFSSQILNYLRKIDHY